MKDWMLAYGMGAVSGSRSLLGPAIAANTSTSPLGGLLGTATRTAAGPRALALLALGELIADKSPWIPARTEALPLAGRVISGAVTASACARPGKTLSAAVAGAAGALTGTYLFFHLRRLASARLGASNLACGLGEDALALATGIMVARCAVR